MANRVGPLRFFRDSLKSPSLHADELINVYLLRPIAALVVWILYPTGITPNQVTIASTIAGLCAAIMYVVPVSGGLIAAGLLVTVKDILDDADGQLARSRQQYSRRGRFLDSIGDAVVDVALFTCMTWNVYQVHPGIGTIMLGVFGCLGITLRVSYHVFYQVSYLHREQRYGLNRLVEDITEEDLKGDRVTLRLQQVFNLIYRWQDRLMVAVDRWCLGGNSGEDLLSRWYGDRFGLRLSGLLGFGTEFVLLTVCTLAGKVHLYLLLNVFLMNGVLLFAVLYRRFVLSGRLLSSPSASARE